MYGTLTVITGGMFAGKTTYLINTVAKNPESIVFKPAMDTRYATKSCVSHDGNQVAAIPVRFPEDLVVGETKKLICFDEVQFFHDPYYCGDITRTIKVFLNAGIDVMACGLDMDWQGDHFPVTGSLLAMADVVVKLNARCHVCAAPAAKSFKKNLDGEVIELGSSDLYEARCNRHWPILNQ